MKIKCPACGKVVQGYYMPVAKPSINRLVVGRHEFKPDKESEPETCSISGHVYNIQDELEYIEDEKLYQVILD